MSDLSPEKCEPPPKKRPKFGRMYEVKKKLLHSTHEIGPDCHCSRLKCFDVVPLEDRKKLISEFNKIVTFNEQNIYLGGLIMVEQVARRRSRQNNEDETQLHNHSYRYKVRLSREGTTLEIPVCYKAFLSLHGITARRVQFLQTHLTEEGRILHDQRGKHKNRPKQLSQKTTNAIDDHIKSLKSRTSHYSLHDSKKLYLPEELNITKLHSMYLEKNPSLPVSYETYRYIFSHKYNISFGYPRTDTCSTCDAFTAEIRVLELKLSDSSVDKQIIENEIKSLTTQNKLHKKKADAFYQRKRSVRVLCQKKTRM